MGALTDITSYTYFLFVVVSLLIYWHTSKKQRWIVLLLCSLLFYFLSASAYTLLYLILSVASVYLATVYFEREVQSQRRKCCCLTIAICISIGILVLLKYTDSGGIRLVPLAISFYTFQLLAYLLDSYWGVIRPEHNILKLFLYTIYFPLMISGPICRYEETGTQITEGFSFDYDMALMGVRRVAWGLLKKMAVANRLSIIVNVLWENVEVYSGPFMWLSTFLYVLEVYMDFSGCMDIISGVSLCFGIRLPENFRAPLFSRSVQEIWQRWHITLGSWAKNYIMYPLQKSKGMLLLQSKLKKRIGKKAAKKITSYLAMLAVWVFIGLWHGRGWKYILGESLWFWLVIVAENLLPSYRGAQRSLRIAQTVRTYLLFSIGLLAFHASSFRDYLYRLGKGFTVVQDFALRLHEVLRLFVSQEIGGMAGLAMLLSGILIVGIADYQKYAEKNTGQKFFFEKYPVCGKLLMIFITGIVLFSVNIAPQEFIYAQF